jgi:hypothetical protein
VSYSAGERFLGEVWDDDDDEEEDGPILPWPSGLVVRPRPFTGGEIVETEFRIEWTTRPDS